MHKITIVSRGGALGYVMSLPEEDQSLISREQIEDTLTGMMGGLPKRWFSAR